MRRVAYLVSRYPATNHTFVLREVVGLRSCGFDVSVVAIRGDERPPSAVTEIERQESRACRYVLPFGRHVVLAHMKTAATRPWRYLSGLALAVRLSRWNLRKVGSLLAYFAEAVVVGEYVRQLRVNHVHTHFSSTVALIAKRIFDLDISMTIHGPGEFDDVVGFYLPEKVAASRFVVTISDFGKSQVMRASAPTDWGRIVTCRLGVDPSHFSPRAHRDDPNRFELITVGRLAPVKAQRVLLEAAKLLADAGRSFRLRIVGPGPDRDALAAAIGNDNLQNFVTLVGAVNQDDLLQMYRETDIFVLASFAEGVPVVLMEAMAREIPCVSTWVNGIPELITNEVSGLLVAPSSATDLASRIAQLMDDSKLRERLGREGRRRVLAEYNLARNAQSLAAVFDAQVRD